MLGTLAFRREPFAAAEPVHGAVESPMGAPQVRRHQIGVVEVSQGRAGIVRASVEDGLCQ